MKYTVKYGSNSQDANEIDSDSRNARKHGEELLGSAGDGWVDIYDSNGKQVSAARYTPEMGGNWYNVVF
ncbi:MAG: hypothetical protein PHG35_09325 [Dehalococcoidales bacterium]|nr:hypothetical protein [Dehalococcoidales bacterium]